MKCFNSDSCDMFGHYFLLLYDIRTLDIASSVRLEAIIKKSRHDRRISGLTSKLISSPFLFFLPIADIQQMFTISVPARYGWITINTFMITSRELPYGALARQLTSAYLTFFVSFVGLD